MARRKPAPAAPQPVVFRWDLDKTYLKSEFESLRELVKIPFEKPEDKVAVPGVVPLIRNLKAVAAAADREARIYFISASPPQIAKAIKEKLALDAVDYDGITFKNQLHNIVRGKFRNLREQVGYKLTELLRPRPSYPPTAREVLFGDDWESDPIIYSLYADVLAGRVAAADLRGIMQAAGADPDLIAEAIELAGAITHIDAVERIYINLERRTPPNAFHQFGPRLVPTFNYFQTACCLFQDGYLNLPAVAEVANHLVENSAYTPTRLANSLADIQRRGHLCDASAIAVREYLRARKVLPEASPARQVSRPWWQRLRTWVQERLTPPAAAVLPETTEINYETLVTEWRQSR